MRLEPVVDHVAFRKIPSLWLKVTLLGTVPYRGCSTCSLDRAEASFTRRSPTWNYELPNPPGWPQDAAIHVDDPALVPSTDVIAPHVRCSRIRA